MNTQPIKGKYFVLEPSDPASVGNNSLFIDLTNVNKLSYKNDSGIVFPLEAGGGMNIFVKQMEAMEAMPLYVAVSKRSDGKIWLTDPDDPDRQTLVGYLIQASAAPGDKVNVLLIGANLPGALTGLGFLPGDEIFVSTSGGYTKDVSGFTTGSYIRVGIADCPGGDATPDATDLIVWPSIVVIGS